MQLLQSLGHRTRSTHGHHLQDALGCAVVRVFGSSRALSHPHVLVLLLNGEMHVFGERLARHQHFAHGQSALHDEALVQPHEVFHPWQRQQVVADGYLACGGEARVDEQHIEYGRVEHNVAVVAHERVVLGVVDRLAVHLIASARLFHQVVDKLVAELHLEVERRLARLHLRGEHVERHIRVEIPHDGLKLRVGQQPIVDLRELLGLERPYIIEFLGYNHKAK